MRNANVLAQTVLVLELLRAVVALARRLRRVLRANVPPQVHRGDNDFAKLTLRPLVERSTICEKEKQRRERERVTQVRILGDQSNIEHMNGETGGIFLSIFCF